jgi:hypothetical protein
VPVQVPLSALSSVATRGVPVIEGATVFTGPLAVTTPVAADDAVALPAVFVAVTAIRNVEPTSVEVTTYDVPVAPEMLAQPPPLELQRCQTRVYVIGVVPDQVPLPDVSTEPTEALPEMVGAVVFTGAPPVTTAVAADSAVAEPSALVAVTATRIVDPTSAETSAYELFVAPVIAAQEAPTLLQRLHW